MKKSVFIIALSAIILLTFSSCVSREDTDFKSDVTLTNQSSNSIDTINSSSQSADEVSSSSQPEVGVESSSQSSENVESSSSSEVSSSSSQTSENSEPSSSQSSEISDSNSSLPLLINVDNPLVPQNYKPDLEMLAEGVYLEKATAKAYWKMVNAASQDGISLWCASGYRSYDLQKKLWDKRYAANLETYKDEDIAYTKTLEWTAYPGRSEHQSGLAVDFNMVDTSFETTKEAKWLYKNAADYGFILRYPKGKTDITKTSYEPWHFRYVGTEYASKIEDSGLCLEEYLEQMEK
ncbi:MAG: M15 family metallopeptidase [Oscillospiraceae bacterium]